jgi:hypothetical protein
VSYAPQRIDAFPDEFMASCPASMVRRRSLRCGSWFLLDGEVEDALPSAWIQGVGAFAEQVESADTLPIEGFEGVNYCGYEDDVMLEPHNQPGARKPEAVHAARSLTAKRRSETVR